MYGDVGAVKAGLDAALNSLEDATASAQAAVEAAQSATGGLILVMEGTGDADMTECAAITQSVHDAFAEQITAMAVASERIRDYMAKL